MSFSTFHTRTAHAHTQNNCINRQTGLEERWHSRSLSLNSHLPRVYRNNFLISSEYYDGLDDRDGVGWFREDSDETEALDRGTACRNMIS
jgi:hypothetical protein